MYIVLFTLQNENAFGVYVSMHGYTGNGDVPNHLKKYCMHMFHLKAVMLIC